MSKRVRQIIGGILLSAFMAVGVTTLTIKFNRELAYVNSMLTDAEKKIELQQEQISTLEQTVESMSNMEFKIYEPSDLTLDLTTELKQEGDSYVAEIIVNGVTANASIATNFVIDGARYSLDLQDFDLLARTVRAETGGMSEQANIATANVIMHRVDSDRYPDSVYSVIHQPYQFEVVDVGTYHKQPTDKAVRATVSALNGVDVVPNALGFWNAEIVPAGHELWQYPIMARIDEHVFSTLSH